MTSPSVKVLHIQDQYGVRFVLVHVERPHFFRVKAIKDDEQVPRVGYLVKQQMECLVSAIGTNFVMMHIRVFPARGRGPVVLVRTTRIILLVGYYESFRVPSPEDRARGKMHRRYTRRLGQSFEKIRGPDSGGGRCRLDGNVGEK